MRKELPARPSLEHLKKQAKDLLAALKRGDVEALSRVRDHLPAARDLTDLTSLALHDMQSVVAREYGFASWAELRSHVESIPSEETLRALTAAYPNAPLPEPILQALVGATSNLRTEPFELPERLPLLPVRNALLSAGSVVPLNIGRPTSIAAVNAAPNGLLAVFSQKDALNATPARSDLHDVGAVVRIAAVAPYDAGLWIVVHALAWIRLDAIEDAGSYAMARVMPFHVQEDDASRESELRDRVRALASALPDGDRIVRMTERMSARELADVTIANLPCSIDDKARYAAEPSLKARLDLLLSILDRAA